MLEIGLSGSEGGVVQLNAPSLPLYALARSGQYREHLREACGVRR
jgi:hypothetical protein